MGKITEDLRECARCAGIEWSAGYVIGALERRVETDTVTALMPVPGDAASSVTFHELGDELFCDDGLTVEQALAVAKVARPMEAGA